MFAFVQHGSTELTRSIDLEHILVGFVISHVDHRVAGEVGALALQRQALVRSARNEHVDDQLASYESHTLERSGGGQNRPSCRVPLPGVPIVNRHGESLVLNADALPVGQARLQHRKPPPHATSYGVPVRRGFRSVIPHHPTHLDVTQSGEGIGLGSTGDHDAGIELAGTREQASVDTRMVARAGSLTSGASVPS